MNGGPDLAAAPDEVRTLVDDLTGAGFAPVAEAGSGVVDRVVELERSGCSIRIVADRAQWWIEVGSVGGQDWFDPDVWEACLDLVPVNREVTPLADRARFVSERWREMCRELEANPDILECLRRARRTRARERLGLPPT